MRIIRFDSMVRPMLAFCLLLGAGCGDNLQPPSEPLVLYEGNVWGGNLAVADGRVFFTTFDHGDELDHAVWSVATDGGVPTLLWHGAPGAIFGYGMAVDDDEVFWSQNADLTNAVLSAPIGGGARTERGRFTTAQAAYTGVVVDADWIFAGSWDQIIRIPRQGGDAEVIFESSVDWIDRDGGPLYFTGRGTLQRFAADGGAPAQVAAIAGAAQFAIVGDVAYVAAADAVWTVSLEGGAPTVLASGLVNPWRIAAGSDAVFTTTMDDDGVAVLRVPLDGGPVETVYRTRISAPQMVVDGNQLYLAFCCDDDASIGGGQVVRLDR